MRRILITSLALCTAALSAACSDSACDSDLVAGGMAMVRAVPQSVTAEAAYAHRVCLIREGVVAQSVSAASAAALAPFRVEPGTYGMLAVAAADEDNLTFPAAEGIALSEYGVRITDMTAPIPDLLIGCNSRFEAVAGSVSAPVGMKRVVAHLTVTVVGLEALSCESITVSIPRMYDRIASDGTPGNSGAEFSEKAIELARNSAGRYVGQAVVLPTDTASATLEFRFTINGKNYVSVQETRIEANRKYALSVAAKFKDDTDLKLTPVISYLPWDAPTTIPDDGLPAMDDRPANDDFTVEIFRNGCWEEIFVYNTEVSDYAANPAAGYVQHDMGFAMFTDAFAAPLKVRVTRRAGTFSKVEIRPLSYGIVPNVQTPNSVEFELDDPAQKVSVEFDGNRMENLFILPDLPDTAIPMGANVTYFGPGVHNAGVIRIANESGRILYLDEGAVVLGRIEAENAANLTIRGRGVFCSSQEDHGAGRRPQMEFRNCDNLKIEGILLRDTPNWTLKIVGSTGVHIDNIKEIGWIMNSDGMDFICCRDVLVENTFQRNYDDNVTIKAFNATPEYIASHTNTDGSYSDGAIWMVAGLRDFEVCNYEIRNCVFWADKAHNMLVGPEARGIAFRNIRFHDNIVLENRQDDGIYPGAMAVMIADDGTFEDIAFENIIVEDIDGGKVFCAHFTNAWAFDGLYGQWARNITLRNIAYTGTRATPSWIRGRSDAQSIDGVTIGNFTVNGTPVTDGSGPHLEINEYVRNVTFE